MRKLYEEGKIKVTDESSIISNEYLDKAHQFLNSAKLLCKHKYFESAIADTYYAAYYATKALLYQTGIKVDNHQARIEILKLFSIDTHTIEQLKKKRILSHYNTKTHLERESVNENMKKAREHIKKIEEHMEINDKEKRKTIQEKIKYLISETFSDEQQ